jgi:hypothetical protein
MDRFQYQYITSLSLIRTSLAENKIDESLAIAVFLVTWIDVVRGKLDTTRKHLKGLHLILQSILKTRPMSGILMQIWWISIKFDWFASLYLVESPIFPIVPIDATDEMQRKWIGTAVLSEETEWALATFTLENLMHKACHYASLIHSMRCDPGLKTPQLVKKVDQVVEILETESRNWINRPIIQSSAQLQLTAQSIQPSFLPPQRPRFLSFPPLYILNVFYANLLNSWRALQIYISLIRDPTIGPSSPSRLTHAIEICRTWTALGKTDITQSEAGKVWIMFLVGVAFGGEKRSGEMGEWIKRRIEDTSSRLPILRRGVEVYGELWEVEGNFWNELDKRRGALSG